MNVRAKTWFVSATGLVVGAVGGGWWAAYNAAQQPPTEGWMGGLADAFSVIFSAIFGGLIGAPIVCYVALRVAKIPRPGYRTVIAFAVGLGLTVATFSIAPLFERLGYGWLPLVAAVATCATPLLIVGMQKGWFRDHEDAVER